MGSSGYVRLQKFKFPVSYRIRCKMARFLTGGKIRATYENQPDFVLITIEFDESQMERVLGHVTRIIKEWGRQNQIPV